MNIKRNFFIIGFILLFLSGLSTIYAGPFGKIAVFPFISKVSDSKYDDWCKVIVVDIEEFFDIGTRYDIVKRFKIKKEFRLFDFSREDIYESNIKPYLLAENLDASWFIMGMIVKKNGVVMIKAGLMSTDKSQKPYFYTAPASGEFESVKEISKKLIRKLKMLTGEDRDNGFSTSQSGGEERDDENIIGSHPLGRITPDDIVYLEKRFIKYSINSLPASQINRLRGDIIYAFKRMKSKRTRGIVFTAVGFCFTILLPMGIVGVASLVSGLIHMSKLKHVYLRFTGVRLSNVEIKKYIEFRSRR